MKIANIFPSIRYYLTINLVCLSTLRFVSALAQPASPEHSVFFTENWLDDRHWVWQGKINPPVFSSLPDGTLSIKAEPLDNNSRTGFPALPCYSRIFNALPQDIRYQIQTANPNGLLLESQLESFFDHPKTELREFTNDQNQPADISYPYPAEIVQVTFIGYVNHQPLTNIKIYPYQLTDDGTRLHYFENLEISVSIAANPDFAESRIAEKSNLEKLINLNGKVRKRRELKTLDKPTGVLPYSEPLIRITVDSTGIYRLAQSALKNSNVAIKKVDPRTFQMFNKGNEVPIFVKGESDGRFDNSDYIEFYGQRNLNSVADYYYDPFTDRNVYYLTWGKQFGLRYAEESAKTTIRSEDAIVPADFEYTMHIEENRHFDKLGQVDTDQPTHTRDHWFFDNGINGGTTRSYIFQLVYPNTGTVEPFDIAVGMHGLTYQVSDHEVTITINNYIVTTDRWSGQIPHVIRTGSNQKLQNRYLRHGDNVIQIAVAGDDPTSKYDRVLFDYLDVRYKRLYRAHNERITFTKPESTPAGRYHFKIGGFQNPDISIYKIGKSKLVDFSVNYSTYTRDYIAQIEDYIHDDATEYFAASREGVLQPLSLQPDTIFNILNEEDAFDLIIITDQQFKYRLSKLTSFYHSIGINPKIVGIKDIYNQFNHGIVSPYAIRDYLVLIHSNWTHQPRFVLLIGDAAIREEESVPAIFFQSLKYGACASDHWYVALDNNSKIPEYAIGRWPVSNMEELDLVIDKRIAYKNSAPVDPWHNEMLFIAGYENAFKNQTENMINRQIPKEFSINRIYIDPASQSTPFFGGSDTLIDLWNKGLTLINFMGHGGGGVWTDRSLFNTSHIKFLDNYNRLPFISSLTCFTADFANVTGMGEYLLLAENGGAIALWGATSIGWIKNDYLIAKPLYDIIFEPGMTIGEAIQYSKIKYLADDYFDRYEFSMVHSYTLLGDPTIEIPFPKKQITLSVSEENPEPGQTIEITGSAPFSSGEIYTQLYDSAKYRIFPEPLSGQIQNGSVRQAIDLPLTIHPGNTFLNYYLVDNNATMDGHGSSLFSIKGLNFYNFSVQPDLPKKRENFQICIRTELTNLDSIICELDTVSAAERLDKNGIEYVVSFTDVSHIIRKKMVRNPTQSNQWQLAAPLQIGTAGKLIGVRFVAVDHQQNRITSPNFSLKIKPAPDLAVIGISQSGSKFPELVARVNYRGDDTLQTDLIAYRLHGQSESLFGTAAFTLLPNRQSNLAIPGCLGLGWQKFKIQIDPENKIDELYETNNILTDSFYVMTYPVTPALGTSIDGTGNDTLKYAAYALFVAPNSLTDSSALIIERQSVTQNPQQPQFVIQSIDGSDELECLEISLPNLADSLLKPLSILISAANSEDENVTIARWNPYLKIWISVATQSITAGYLGKSSYPGKFTLMKCQDTEPPKLELSLDGQQFFQNSYVSRRPNISIIAEDRNGVLFNQQGLQVFLDGNPVAFANLNIPDTLANGNYVSAQFRPELEYGDHDLEVIIKDAAGNSTADQVFFNVSDELKLIDYGNYPNPFKDRTVFIYELTQRVDDFKIKIYTTSGRLIKILAESTIFSTGLDMNEGGYHEIIWNGLDENGNFIANGVYFYKMIAKKDKKTVTQIGKIAKAR